MSDNIATEIPIDLNDPEFYRNPYPAYKWLRENAPVCWFEPIKGWLISTATDITFCSHDSRFSRNFHTSGVEHLPMDERLKYEPFLKRFGMWMMFKDGRNHTRVRRLMNKSFTPRALEALRPHIEDATNCLLDSLAQKDSVDLMSEFAMPLPAQIIAHMLGVSSRDYHQLVEWTHAAINLLLKPATPEVAQKAQYSYEQLEEVFRKAIAQRRKNLIKNEVLTELILAEEEGDILTEEELIAQCIMLLTGGNETTRILISGGIIALLQHSDQFKLLKKNPELMPNAIEELLRYVTPSQLTIRRVEEDLEIRNRQLRAGDIVYLFLASANRDPEYFTDPDRLDITRKNNKHFAFGAIGQPHFCIGANLSRLEAGIALRSLFQRFPDLKLAQKELKWIPNFCFRRVESLPVILK